MAAQVNHRLYSGCDRLLCWIPVFSLLCLAGLPAGVSGQITIRLTQTYHMDAPVEIRPTLNGREINLSRCRDLKSDPVEARIAYTEAGEHRIVFFNEDFIIESMVGQFAQGPGEFRGLNGVRYLANGELLLHEAGNRRFQHLGRDGKAITIVEYPPPTWGIGDYIGLDNNRILFSPLSSPWSRFPELVLINTSAGTIDSFTTEATMYDVNPPNPQFHRSSVLIEVTSDGRLIILYQMKPTLLEMNQSLEIIRRFQLDLPEPGIVEDVVPALEERLAYGSAVLPIYWRDMELLDDNSILLPAKDYSMTDSFTFYIISLSNTREGSVATRLYYPLPENIRAELGEKRRNAPQDMAWAYVPSIVTLAPLKSGGFLAYENYSQTLFFFSLNGAY